MHWLSEIKALADKIRRSREPGSVGLSDALCDLADRFEKGIGHRNPTLAIVNPRGGVGGRPIGVRHEGLMGTAVYRIFYRHASDEKDYFHEFDDPENVELWMAGPHKVVMVGRDAPIIDMFETE